MNEQRAEVLRNAGLRVRGSVDQRLGTLVVQHPNLRPDRLVHRDEVNLAPSEHVPLRRAGRHELRLVLRLDAGQGDPRVHALNLNVTDLETDDAAREAATRAGILKVDSRR